MTDSIRNITRTNISRRRALAGLGAGASLVAMPWIARAADDTIRIGFPTPLTGPFAAEAKDQVKSAELAVKQFNDKGGINGRKIELLVRDDKLNRRRGGDPHAGADREGQGACGGWIVVERGATCRQRSDAGTGHHLRLHQPVRHHQRGQGLQQITFHEALNPHMTAGAVARYSFKKGSKVAHLVADYAYGHEMLRGFKRAQAAIGAETVGEILHPFGAADYSTFMPRLRSMRPDFLCISNFGRDQANSIKQAVDFGLKQQAKIVVPVILHNQRLAVGPRSSRASSADRTTTGASRSQLPAPRRSTMPIRAANGGAIPTDYGAYGYTGLSSLLMAMQVAGGTDTDKVIAALEGLNMTWRRARKATASAITSRCSPFSCSSRRKRPI